MKRKILAMTLLLAIMASMLAFVSCVDDEEDVRSVEIVLLDPYTGEALNGVGERIKTPEEGTMLTIKVIDKETGEELTDEDILPDNTIQGSLHITYYRIYDDPYRLSPYGKCKEGEWPFEDGKYEISILFDHRPQYHYGPYIYKYGHWWEYFHIELYNDDEEER